MRVVVWDMQGKTTNWTTLDELEADVALVCEARVADYSLPAVRPAVRARVDRTMDRAAQWR